MPELPRPSTLTLKAQIVRARSEIGALISLLSHAPELQAAYREAKAAERTLAWVETHVVAKRGDEQA